MASYFSQLCTRVAQDAVAVVDTGGARGKIVVAQRAFGAGECVFSERPYVAMQHWWSRCNREASEVLSRAADDTTVPDISSCSAPHL